MREMTAKRRFRYANRALVPGDDFVAKDAHAAILHAVGRAEPKAVAAAAPKRRRRKADQVQEHAAPDGGEAGEG